MQAFKFHMAKNNVKKGKLLEDHVAQRIRDLGLDPKAYRSHGSGNGNTEKGDIWTSVQIFGRNLGIEVKNQQTVHIPEWWRQVQKLEDLGREPVLAFKLHGESLDGTKVVIYLDTFLELIRASRVAAQEARPKDLKGIAKDLRQLAQELSPE